MNKEEIQKKIYALNTDEDIESFVNERIKELEASSIETTVGQNYTDSFNEYISLKTHYKPADKLDEETECPDLVYDDVTPYIELIKSIREGKWYSELSLFSDVFFVINNYLPTDNIGFGRYMAYLFHKDGKISIKSIREHGCAFCSEKAGLAHNMFKFLGVDSAVVSGGRNGGMHAYNFVFPNGYGNEPMVLYDPSFFVDFVKDNDAKSFGFFKAFKKEDFEKLLSGEPIKLDLSNTEKNYRNLYGFNGMLDGYSFVCDNPTYVYGLVNAKEYKSSFKK